MHSAINFMIINRATVSLRYAGGQVGGGCGFGVERGGGVREGVWGGEKAVGEGSVGGRDGVLLGGRECWRETGSVGERGVGERRGVW